MNRKLLFVLHIIIPYGVICMVYIKYLLRTHIKQVFPSAVNLFLILYKEVLVFRLEQMLESALWTKEVFDWKLLLWLIV